MKNISDPQTEVMILSKAFRSADSCNEIINELNINDFFDKAAKEIFLAIYTLTVQNKRVTVDSVCYELHEDLSKIGGQDILTNVYSCYSNSYELSDLIDDLKKTSRIRNFYLLTHKISNTIENEDIKEPDDFIETSTQDISKLSYKQKKGSLLVSEILKQERTVFNGFKTNYQNLDEKIKGFSRGQLIIVGGRPGQGKSTFMMNLIEKLSLLNTLIFSLEMTDNDIAYCLAYLQANLDMNKDSFSLDDERKLLDAKAFYTGKNVVIDDEPGITPNKIYSRGNKMKQGKGLDLIFIDYLQLMNGNKRDYENNQVKVASISRELKSIAKKLNVPIVTMAQLNRTSEQRTDKRPILSDLRESGSLEADADIVLLLHRPSYYNFSSRPGVLEVNIAKNRFGETGRIDFAWNLKTKRMNSLSYEKPEMVDESDNYADFAV